MTDYTERLSRRKTEFFDVKYAIHHVSGGKFIATNGLDINHGLRTRVARSRENSLLFVSREAAERVRRGLRDSVDWHVVEVKLNKAKGMQKR